MCGSASERTRAISWGEMVIEECPGKSGGGAAGGNIAAPFSEPPARAKEGCAAAAVEPHALSARPRAGGDPGAPDRAPGARVSLRSPRDTKPRVPATTPFTRAFAAL